MSLFLPCGVYNSKCNEDLLCKNDKSLVCDSQIETDKKSETVYITKTGKCYHKSWCKHLRQSKIPLNKEKAKIKHSPYKDCYFK